MSHQQQQERASRRVVALVVLAAAVAFGVGFYTGDRAARPDPASMEGIVASLTAQQEQDHRQMTGQLVEVAGGAHSDLMGVLAGMNRAMPVEAGAVAEPPTPEEVEAWKRSTRVALERFSGFGTGTTEFNGALAALRGAVEQIDGAGALYGEALSAESARLAELAAGIRDRAAELWAAGAEQLDGLAIATGQGHVHLFLPVTGDPEAVPIEFREPQGQ